MLAYLQRLLPGRTLIAFCGLTAGPGGSTAADRSTAALSAPRMVLVAPGYHVPVPFRINAGATPSKDLILEIRGVPSSLSFSHGENLDHGIWRMPASAIPQATLHASHLAEARVQLSVSLIEQPSRRQHSVEEKRYIANARRLLDHGQVDQARRFLERAAVNGSAEAAELMASTYEATEFSKWKVHGLKPDPVEAQKWRAHAQSLARLVQVVLAKQEVSLLAAPKELLPAQRQPAITIGTWKTEVHWPEAVRAPKVDTQRLLQRGEVLLAKGRVVQSREYFRRAADAGSAPAALKLAMTFDATELARLQSRGLRPDDGQARHWYSRARELGAVIPHDRGVVEASMNRKH